MLYSTSRTRRGIVCTFPSYICKHGHTYTHIQYWYLMWSSTRLFSQGTSLQANGFLLKYSARQALGLCWRSFSLEIWTFQCSIHRYNIIYVAQPRRSGVERMCKHTHTCTKTRMLLPAALGLCCCSARRAHVLRMGWSVFGVSVAWCIWSAFAHACVRICGGNGYAVLGTFNTNMHACVCRRSLMNDNGEMPHTAAVVAGIHVLQVKHWWMFLRMVYASDDRNVHTTADNPYALLRDCLPGEDGGQKKGLLAFRCDIVEVWRWTNGVVCVNHMSQCLRRNVCQSICFMCVYSLQRCRVCIDSL